MSEHFLAYHLLARKNICMRQTALSDQAFKKFLLLFKTGYYPHSTLAIVLAASGLANVFILAETSAERAGWRSSLIWLMRMWEVRLASSITTAPRRGQWNNYRRLAQAGDFKDIRRATPRNYYVRQSIRHRQLLGIQKWIHAIICLYH